MCDTYTFVDKNCIIPYIQVFNSKKKGIDYLLNYTTSKNNENCENIYIIHENYYITKKIYMCKEDVMYSYTLNEHKTKKNNYKFSSNCVNNDKKEINKFIKTLFRNTKDDKIAEHNNDNYVNEDEDDNIIYKPKIAFSKKDIVKKDIVEKDIVEKDIAPIIDTKKISVDKLEKEKLEKMIQEMKDELTGKKSQMSTLERDITAINKKKEKELKNYDLARIKNLSNVKNDYKLYKELEDERIEGKMLKIPPLYANTYDHINYLVRNESIKQILDEIYSYDIDEIYISEKFEIEDEVLTFSKNYAIKSKENHLSFEHRWEKLEDDESVRKLEHETFIDNVD